ncbi:MAG: hypothetical protein WCX46_04350 [Candidatus Paceibacterota bacterium]
MRIGNTVVRVKEEFNLHKIGDISVIDGLKIYNKGVCIHLEGDKPDTWHSQFNYRLIEDVDMQCLADKLSHVKRSLNAFNGHIKEANKERAARAQVTKKRNKIIATEPEDDFGDSVESFKW